MTQPAGQPLDLDPIQAREQAATPGPWHSADRIIGGGNSGRPIAEMYRYSRYHRPDVDGEFIAHARADVPALLAEVRRLRAVEAAAYAFADEMATYCSPHGVAADYAQRLSDRLDAARTPATKEAR